MKERKGFKDCVKLTAVMNDGSFRILHFKALDLAQNWVDGVGEVRFFRVETY